MRLFTALNVLERTVARHSDLRAVYNKDAFKVLCHLHVRSKHRQTKQQDPLVLEISLEAFNFVDEFFAQANVGIQLVFNAGLVVC